MKRYRLRQGKLHEQPCGGEWVRYEDAERLRELALKVCEYVDRCQYYGPADALMSWAKQLREAAEAAGGKVL